MTFLLIRGNRFLIFIAQVLLHNMRLLRKARLHLFYLTDFKVVDLPSVFIPPTLPPDKEADYA